MSAPVTPGFGLGIFDTRLSPTTIAAQGAGALQSSYTEAGPVPGVPSPTNTASRWRPQIRQAQAASITVATIRGGYPGRDAASVIGRLATESAGTDYRSWQEPNLITGWSAPSDGWGSAIAYTDYAATVIPATGVIVIVAMDNATSDAQTWSYDPATRTWTTLYDWDAGALDGLNAPIAMTYDVDKSRLLLWSGVDTYRGATGFVMAVAYYSDDGGVSWSRYSQGIVYGQAGLLASSTTEMSVAQAPTGEWMMCTQRFTNRHWASSDRGVTWSNIEATTISRGRVVYGPAGFLLIAVDGGTGDLVCKQAASARGTLATLATISSARDYTQCVACVDADGTVYALANGTSAASTIGNLYMFRSTDGGTTWAAYDWHVYSSGSTTDYLVPLQLLASSGSLWLVCTCTGTANTDNTVQMLRLGGWGQVSHGAGEYYGLPTYRFGWGVIGSPTNASSIAYLPISAPGNVGWTAVTATGTASLTSATPALVLTTTAGQGQTYQAVTGASALFCAGEIDIKLDAAGNVTLATIGVGGGGVEYSPRLKDGAGYNYTGHLDIGTDGIQWRDGTTTIRATVALDMTSQFTRIRVAMTKGTATSWYSRDDGATWSPPLRPFPALNDAGLLAFDAVAFGALVAARGFAFS